MIPSRFTPVLRFLTVAACGAVLASPHTAGAQPASETKTLDEWANLYPVVSSTGITVIPLQQGAPGTGISMNADAATTVNRPVSNFIIAYPFRTGSVDLVALLRSGSTSGTIDVSVTGYAAGLYTVSAVTESSSSTVVLGTLTVTSGSFPIWSGSAPILYANVKPVVADSMIAFPIWELSTGNAEFGGAAAPFPAGFSPFDVATLSLSDSNGNVVSTAALTPVQNGFLTALSPLVAGASAPRATGYALLRANTPPYAMPMTPGVSAAGSSAAVVPLPPIYFNPLTGQLTIHAHGLPAGARLTYALDGTDVGTARTDARGNLNVSIAQGAHGKLPATLDFFSVTTVTVHDSLGNVLVSAEF